MFTWKAAFKKFSDYLPKNNAELYYVNAARVNEHYTRIIRGKTQIDLIQDFKLDYTITRSKGNKKANINAGDPVELKNLDDFNPRTMKISVPLNQLTDIERLKKLKASADTIKYFKKLIKKIADAADINEEEPDYVFEQEIIIDKETHKEEDKKVLSAIEESNMVIDKTKLEIIYLEDHEKIRDADDNVFEIEMLGDKGNKKRTYMKGTDVERFYEKPRLIETILGKNANYKYGKDYVIMTNDYRPNRAMNHSKETNDKIDQNDSSQQSWVSHSKENNDKIDQNDSPIDSVHGHPKETNNKIDHNDVYFLTNGFIRAAYVSRSPNANMEKILDWIDTLYYTHQFGTSEQRYELSLDLTKTILNDKLSGLYCIEIGLFENLYESMQIDLEKYPLEVYAKHKIYKYGLSTDINKRLAQHKNTKDKYGRWSDNISLKWMILMPESQLYAGEKMLSMYFKASNFTFEYVDELDKSHNELIIVSSKDESKIKTIYKQTLAFYPSKENELCKYINDLETKYEHDLLKITHTYEMQLNESRVETIVAKKDVELSQKDVELANQKIETLTLKLQIAMNK